MPALVARAHEEGRAADRPADQPVVDGAARGLVGAAEKGVGRRAEPQALGRRGFDQPARLGDRDAERLFRVDVLAGGDRLEADLDMGVRNREVEDDLDRRIGEQRVDRTRRNPELRRARFRRLRVGVGERDEIEDRELSRRSQIGGADVSATDDADSDRLHHDSPSCGTGASRIGAGPVVPHGAP